MGDVEWTGRTAPAACGRDVAFGAAPPPDRTGAHVRTDRCWVARARDVLAFTDGRDSRAGPLPNGSFPLIAVSCVSPVHQEVGNRPISRMPRPCRPNTRSTL